jgi:hypothetical protein
MRCSPIALALLLLACSGQDPILDRAADMQGGGAAPTAGAPAPGKTGSPPPTAGTPEPPRPGQGAAPSPADPGAPAPGDPGAPSPGVPDQPTPGVPGSDGPSVALAGTVQVEDWGGGPIRIDIFDGDQQAAAGSSKRPSVVAQARLEKPGPFEVRVPVGTTNVWIGGFADENRNGRPDPRDPSGWFGGNPVSVDGDQSGITLQLRSAPPPGGGVEME